MHKILAGFLGLVMVSAVVGGTAYALFSANATVTGMTIATGNADLLVGPTSSLSSPTNRTWATGLNLSNMYPGYENFTSMHVRNDSDSPIALNVTAKLTTLPSGWGNYLTYAAQVKINTSDDSSSTGWKSLPQWQSTAFALPGGKINQNTTVPYKVYVRIPLTYGANESGYTGSGLYSQGNPVGNEVADQTLSGAAFTLVGTQVTP